MYSGRSSSWLLGRTHGLTRDFHSLSPQDGPGVREASGKLSPHLLSDSGPPTTQVLALYHLGWNRPKLTERDAVPTEPGPGGRVGRSLL